MQITINKTKITLTVIAVILVDLWLFFAPGPEIAQHAARTVPGVAIILGPFLIATGVATQLWMRGKHEYRYMNLLAYGLTLIWSMSYGFIVLIALSRTFGGH